MDTSIYIFQEFPHSLCPLHTSQFPTLPLFFPLIPHKIPPTTPASVPLQPELISLCPSHLSPYQYHSKPLLHCNYLTNQPTQSLSHYWCYYSSEQDCWISVNLEEVKVLALEATWNIKIGNNLILSFLNVVP